MSRDDHEYHALLSTFRLYAGWLLACLLAVFAAGSYQQLRSLPVRFPILDEWMDSAMLRDVLLVTFLFLLLSSMHQLLRGGFWKGILLTAGGFALMVIWQLYG